MNNFLKLPALTLGLVLPMTLAMPARGEWGITPSAQLQTEYDDNVRMSTDNANDAFITTATGQVRLQRITETSAISATAGLSFLKYSGVNNLDDQDMQFLDLNLSKKQERAQFRLNGSYRRDLMLRRSSFIQGVDDLLSNSDPQEDTEIIPDDLEEIPDLDDAATRLQIRRERVRVQPSVRWQFSERLNGNIAISHSSLSYGRAAQLVGLRDNNSQTGKLTLSRRMSDKNTLSVSTSIRLFDPDRNAKSQNYELRTILNHQYSERSQIGVQIGVRRTKVDASANRPSSKDTGFTFRVNGSRSYQRTHVRASAERSILPNSFGQLVEADRLSLGVTHKISARADLLLDTRAYTTDSGSSSNTDDGQKRKFLQLSPTIQYRLTPTFNMNLAYKYTWVDRAQNTFTTPGSASGSSLALALSYTPLSQN
ncbi:MAG: outer membrane beta-barrel protein [Pseudomonadales bacterium]|nr:outer membrane beta-barrel protein [Pseudomonadales bacterium]